MPGTVMSMLTGGGLGASFGSQSQNTNSTQNTNQNTSGTSTTSRNLNPYQSATLSPLSNLITNLMQNPQSFVAPFQTAARNDVNANYSGLADNLRKQFMQTGGGASGKFGTALAGADVSRLSGLSGVDTAFSQTAAELPLSGANLAQNLLSQNFGQTTTGNQSTTGTSSGTSSTSSGGFGFKI